MRGNPRWLGLAVLVLVMGSVAAGAADFELEASDGEYDHCIVLEWEEVTGPVPVGYYIVHRSESGGRFRQIAIRDEDQTSYRDYQVFPCGVYEYYISVVWDYSPLPESNVDEGYTVAIPNAPQSPSWRELALGDSALELSWEEIPGADYYEIRRHETQTGSSVLSWTTERPTVEFTDVGPCTYRYWYDIRSCSECGCSAWSSPQQQPSIYAIPRRPTWITPTTMNDVCQPYLEWQGDDIAQTYELQRIAQQIGLSNDYESLGTVSESNVVLTTTANSDCSRRWEIYVRACNCDGCSEWSFPTFIVWGGGDLPAPERVTADAITSDHYGEGLRISWNNVPGCTGYRIFESSSQPDTLNRRPVWTGTTTQAEIFGSSVCSPTYWIQACCVCGCGDLVSVQASTEASHAVVSDVRASIGTQSTAVRVDWTPGPGHDFYDIYRRGPDEVAYELIVSGVWDATYRDVNVIPCQTYSYKISGCNACGCGPLSEAAEGSAGWVRCVPEVWMHNYDDGSPVSIEWRGCADARWHQLIRTDPETGETVVVAELAIPPGEEDQTHIYEDRPPKRNVWYQYSVQACNECGCTTSFPKPGYWK